jgi:hypothetical protein
MFLVHLRHRWISGHLTSTDKGKNILNGDKEMKGDELPFRLEIRGCFLSQRTTTKYPTTMREHYETKLNDIQRKEIFNLC